jgi:histidinol dehydrogenase
MKIVKYPQPDTWAEFTKRESLSDPNLSQRVAQIIADVRERRDQAVAEYTARFDGVAPEEWRISLAERDTQAESVSKPLLEAIEQAIANITRFHSVQCVGEQAVETMPGVFCYRKAIPLERVGLYVPAGTAPLFSSLLMLAIPAQLAGTKQIAVCTPTSNGRLLEPAIAFCAKRLGISEIYRVGGAQAIAALAFGTESIRAVDLIGGPGNQYVAEAKLQVAQAGIRIDTPAGPSEVLIIADGSADPEFVAADLLAQAEHGVDSNVILVTDTESLATRVGKAVSNQLPLLPRALVAEAVMERASALVVGNLEEAVRFSNLYAPEHLIVNVENSEAIEGLIRNAGSVFIGAFAAEAIGDYASGTNHVLPTAGWARTSSGVSVDTFTRKVTFQRVSREGCEAIAPTVIEMARAEGLEAHAQAICVRIKGGGSW